MIAALIFVVSLAALLQFFVSYCRSVIAGYNKQELSEQAREVTGIEDRIVQGDDFRRLLQLAHLCPEPGGDSSAIRAIRTYYTLLNVLRSALGSLVPAVGLWVEHERETCAYFAAVALDRRIAHNRDLMARQISNRI